MADLDTEVAPYRDVVGQHTAIEQLHSCAGAPVHAYLLVGPPGSGVDDLAVGFAADLLCGGLGPTEAQRTCDLVLARRHPDVVVVGAEGTAVRREEAERLRAAAVRTPVEGHRKVLIGTGFDVIQPEAAALLLKTLEEPAPSTVMVLVAEDVPPELITLASRCVRVDVGPLAAGDLREALLVESAAEEWPVDRIDAVVDAAEGDLERARLLMGDERFVLRRDAWAAVPDRLDGTGAMAYRSVDDLLAMIDDVAAPLAERQAAERAELEEEVETYGLRRGVLKDLDTRHKRQTRRVHRDEITEGLRQLARRYRDAAVSASPDDSQRLAEVFEAQRRIDATAAALVRNPNERLQLQALFLRLPRLG